MSALHTKLLLDLAISKQVNQHHGIKKVSNANLAVLEPPLPEDPCGSCEATADSPPDKACKLHF